MEYPHNQTYPTIIKIITKEYNILDQHNISIIFTSNIQHR